MSLNVNVKVLTTRGLKTWVSAMEAFQFEYSIAAKKPGRLPVASARSLKAHSSRPDR